jgi:DNA gyrase subunit A
MGDYVPTKLSMDDDERVIACKMIKDINVKHHMIYIFENGKGVRVPMSAYDALPTRKKITGVCSSSSPLVAAFYEGDKPLQIFIRSDMGRGILIKSSIIPIMSTRTASGNQILQFAKKVGKIDLATDRLDALGTDVSKCYKTVIPNTGSIINQLTFNF